ncbi:Leucine-rich repeat-containing protein 7, partial [Lamprotornis superbus]
MVGSICVFQGQNKAAEFLPNLPQKCSVQEFRCHLLQMLNAEIQNRRGSVCCLEMTSKRKLLGRLVPCRCFRGEEEIVSVLDYSHCGLQQVPKEVFNFERTLEELYLDANQIEELPKHGNGENKSPKENALAPEIPVVS